MSKRAEEAALKAYPDCESPNWAGKPVILFKQMAFRQAYQQGYEQAEKDTIERATGWILSHTADYFGFGMVYPEKFKEDFRKAMG